MSSRGEEVGQALGQLLQLVFSLLFPLIMILSCAAAFVLLAAGFMHFALLAGLAIGAVEYAKGHPWAAVALAIFVLASLPLARVAYREAPAITSSVIGNWVAAILAGAFTLWLATVWPATDPSVFQQIVFAFLLFGVVGTFCEAVIGSLKLREINRPRPGPEVVKAQKAHGDARLAGETEAVGLLNGKK